MDRVWLPKGEHWGLTIEHQQLEDAGQFVGGGHKQLWHTAEGRSLSGCVSTVEQKRAAPHVCLDMRTGHCVQTVPFNLAARALEHPSGTPETNRANCWQVELCDYAANSGTWSHAMYRNVAALACLMEHRTKVPRESFVSFANPTRLSGDNFYNLRGHCGHVHAANNSHTDPGEGFRMQYVFKLMKELTEKYGGHAPT